MLKMLNPLIRNTEKSLGFFYPVMVQDSLFITWYYVVVKYSDLLFI